MQHKMALDTGLALVIQGLYFSHDILVLGLVQSQEDKVLDIGHYEFLHLSYLSPELLDFARVWARSYFSYDASV